MLKTILIFHYFMIELSVNKNRLEKVWKTQTILNPMYLHKR